MHKIIAELLIPKSAYKSSYDVNGILREFERKTPFRFGMMETPTDDNKCKLYVFVDGEALAQFKSNYKDMNDHNHCGGSCGSKAQAYSTVMLDKFRANETLMKYIYGCVYGNAAYRELSDKELINAITEVFPRTVDKLIVTADTNSALSNVNSQMNELVNYIASTPLLKEMYANFMETDEQKAAYKEGRLDARHVAAKAHLVFDRTITSLEARIRDLENSQAQEETKESESSGVE